MSRENRVNPGTYTQAGRLTPDDAARELVKQRQSMGNSRGKAHPKGRTEAWMHQASRTRESAAAPEPAHTSAAVFLLAAGAAICLSLYVVRRLARRHSASTVPATNHTPGRPYAYGI
ncbi:MAG: hypothetical protein AB7P34_06760 [Vicinamibacterales bacterium]